MLLTKTCRRFHFSKLQIFEKFGVISQKLRIGYNFTIDERCVHFLRSFLHVLLRFNPYKLIFSKVMRFKTYLYAYLIGVRRSGKSFILNMFRDYLINTGVEQDRIIFINFEHPDTDGIKNYSALNEHLKSLVKKSSKIYFLFDEIQEVKAWQRVINGLRVAYDSDIYITSSNATILSGELATLLLSNDYKRVRHPKNYKSGIISRKKSNIFG